MKNARKQLYETANNKMRAEQMQHGKKANQKYDENMKISKTVRVPLNCSAAQLRERSRCESYEF